MNTSKVALKGSTVSPTMRSATASDTMKRLVTERSLELMKTAAMTRQLPTITITLISSRTVNVAICPGSSQTNLSNTAAHSLAFITATQDVSESPVFGITTCPDKLLLHLIYLYCSQRRPTHIFFGVQNIPIGSKFLVWKNAESKEDKTPPSFLCLTHISLCSYTRNI